MKIQGVFANNYDRFVKRDSLLPPALERLIKSVNPQSILEFGCGTGTIAVGLALNTFDVTAVDFSDDMLKIARRKANTYRTKIKFIKADIAKIDLGRTFDCIICLGNILPQFRSASSLAKLLENCQRHLNPDGVLIAQQLNYDRILKSRPATFATDIDENLMRIKQYRYHREYIDFVVTLLDTSVVPPARSSHSSRLKPWKADQLLKHSRIAGFGKIEIFGNYDKEVFTLDSKDAVLYAVKS